MDIISAINKLKTLNLSTYPHAEIDKLLREGGRIDHVNYFLRKGKTVMRARPNYNGERFEKKSDYSFKPQSFNKTYQRASTPNHTMFYGSVLPDIKIQGELDNLRTIGIVETISMLSDINKSGYQKISFGKWEVLEDISLIAIIQNKDYTKSSAQTNELYRLFNSHLSTLPAESKENSTIYTDFLAKQFSKTNIKGDYDYMISAIFSEYATSKGFDGIYYPSVKVGGRGFNIAITPKATEKLSLKAAGECSIYKRNELTLMSTDAVVELNGNEETFRLIDNPSREKDFLLELGVSSIDELNSL